MTCHDSERLKRDVGRVLDDLTALADAGDERAHELAERMRMHALDTRDRVRDLQEEAVVRMRRAGRHARGVARHHPWATALAAAATVAAAVVAWRSLARRNHGG